MNDRQLGLEPLLESWRWFGPGDPVSLVDARQAGATGIVTALHDVPTGEVWRREAIDKRAAEIALTAYAGQNALHWAVVESLAVHDDIKRGDATRDKLIDAWIDSLRNLAAAGIKRIAYHFMPVFDWTRTDLKWRVPESGGLALRFDFAALVAFDVFMLKRPYASDDYNKDQLDAASNYWSAQSEADRDLLCATMVRGLPGGHDSFSMETFRNKLNSFRGITRNALRENLKYFLSRVIPVAEELGVLLALHPDDPPIPLLGIPRIVSTMEDFGWLADSEPSPNSGLTFCVGSLSSSARNDVHAILERFVSRVHFVHGRNVRIEQDRLSFYESNHLSGDANLPTVLHLVMREQARRKVLGQATWRIPVRPDHGHLLLEDALRDCNPGYSAIGRLKGLAEIRGAMKAIECLHGEAPSDNTTLALAH